MSIRAVGWNYWVYSFIECVIRTRRENFSNIMAEEISQGIPLIKDCSSFPSFTVYFYQRFKERIQANSDNEIIRSEGKIF